MHWKWACSAVVWAVVHPRLPCYRLYRGSCKILDPFAVAYLSAGSSDFNAVHLRIEKDAGAWAQILGGRHVVEARYR
jgi:hypothetical protein